MGKNVMMEIEMMQMGVMTSVKLRRGGHVSVLLLCVMEYAVMVSLEVKRNVMMKIYKIMMDVQVCVPLRRGGHV